MMSCGSLKQLTSGVDPQACFEFCTYTATNVIELFHEQKYYEIDLDTKECKSGDLNFPFVPHGVVRNGTL